MSENNTSSEVYYFWTDAETNTHGVTVADSDRDDFSVVEEFTFDELSTITASEDENGNGEGAAWGDAVVSSDGSRIFVNARNADKVAVINTETREVETILDVGDRPVHSFVHEGEIWVHVDGDGGFNVIDAETLEVSEVIDTNTVGTGHGKLLVSEGLGIDTYVTNTAEPAVFPINLDTREVGEPIEIGGGDPEIGTHDKGYDPATGLAFFQLTGDAGFSFIDVDTNEVVLDQVPILGRIAHTPNDEYILILNAEAEESDIGIWDTTLDTHTQPEFDREVTIGGQVSVNGTEFYQDGDVWEAWIPQTEGDNVAILNLSTNEVELIDVGNLTIPEGARHFSRRGEADSEDFFTYNDDGAIRIDLDTSEVSAAIPLGGSVSRIAVVESEAEETIANGIELNATLTPEQVIGDVVPESTATASATFNLTENGLEYFIQFEGLDLVPPEERVGEGEADTGLNDVTGVHLHFGAEGGTGQHLLNIFGLPGEDDSDLVIDYENETLRGIWDDSDPQDLNGDGVIDAPFESKEFTFYEQGNFIANGQTYLQIHTSQYPTGEIRGQVEISSEATDPETPDPEVTSPLEEESLQPVFGTINGDVIEIAGSNQLLFAGDLNDLVDAAGGEGDNRIYTGNGDDTIVLGKGDRILAGEGSDRFFATSGGDNTITGGTDADRFWIASAELPDEANMITDFTVGEDIIGIAGLGIGFADLNIVNVEGDILISANGSDLAILQGVAVDSLGEDNFAFA